MRYENHRLLRPSARPGAAASSDAAAGRQFAEAEARLVGDHDLVIHDERMARTAGSATRDIAPDDAAPAATTRSHDLTVLEQGLRKALPTTKPVAVVLAMIEVAAAKSTPQAVARKIRRLAPRRHHHPAAPPPVELVPGPVRMLPRASSTPAPWSGSWRTTVWSCVAVRPPSTTSQPPDGWQWRTAPSTPPTSAWSSPRTWPPTCWSWSYRNRADHARQRYPQATPCRTRSRSP